MKNIHERLKNPKAKRGCLLCYSMGTAAPAYAYVDVEYVPLSLMPNQVAMVKEIGVCFKHSSRGAKVLNPEIGPWRKTSFGYMPEREGKFELIGGPVDGAKLLIGACRRGIPTWW